MKQKKTFLIVILFAILTIYMTNLYTNYYISVNAVPDIKVIPMGNAVGVKVYSEGVLVIGTSQVEGVDGNTHEPYNDTQIKSGDVILKINDEKINNIEELTKLVNSSHGREMKISYKRDDKEFVDTIKPIKSLDDGKYKIGLWVRDGTTGIGTLTFYAPELNKYGALGHGISDIDVKTLLPLDEGTLNEASILSIVKGVKTSPRRD